MRKIKYVLGFYFCGDNVLLIRKNSPEWQKGKLNGIGGRIKSREDPKDAMIREFQEETGQPVLEWYRLCEMRDPEWSMLVFYTYGPHFKAHNKTTKEGVLSWNGIDYTPDRINDLKWLIPMAFYMKCNYNIIKIR